MMLLSRWVLRIARIRSPAPAAAVRLPSTAATRPKPDVSAPGVGVRSALPGTSYGTKSGTSMAAPHVAGLVALLVSARPWLKGQVDEIESIIRLSAVPLTTTQSCSVPGSQVPNNTYGWGRIDAWAAYQMILTPKLYISFGGRSLGCTPSLPRLILKVSLHWLEVVLDPALFVLHSIGRQVGVADGHLRPFALVARKSLPGESSGRKAGTLWCAIAWTIRLPGSAPGFDRRYIHPRR